MIELKTAQELIMRIEIISTGDEVITGSIDDTNATFISRELIDIGLQVVRRHTVGDNLEELMRLFTDLAKEPSIAIVTGGLGPTPDDLTTEAIARVAKVPLMLNERWLEHMRKWFESRGREMAKANIKQAMLPQDSLFIDNPVGTACGFIVKIEKTLFIFAPGVPRELKAMWEATIKDLVLSFTKNSTTKTTIIRRFIMGIGESDLSEKLSYLTLPSNIVIGDRAVYPYIELKLIGHNADDESMQHIDEKLNDLVGRYTICKGEMNLKEALDNAKIETKHFHSIDAVSLGTMPHELQQTLPHFIDCNVFNLKSETYEEAKKSFAAALDFFSDDNKNLSENLIALLPKDITNVWQKEAAKLQEVAKTKPFQYELYYSLNVVKDGATKLKQGHIIMSFSRDFYEEANYVRNREFLSKLCVVELYKVLMEEPLLEPNECAITHIIDHA